MHRIDPHIGYLFQQFNYTKQKENNPTETLLSLYYSIEKLLVVNMAEP